MVRLVYRRFTIFVIIVSLLSVLSLCVSIFAFSQQAGVAEDKANEAIRTAQTAGAETVKSVCIFILTFVVKEGEPKPTTERGRLTGKAARKAYLALDCPRQVAPLPPEPIGE